MDGLVLRRATSTDLDSTAEIHEAAARAGYRRAVHCVPVGNARAPRFYEHRGWIADGARRTGHHAIDVEIMRYVRNL